MKPGKPAGMGRKLVHTWIIASLVLTPGLSGESARAKSWETRYGKVCTEVEKVQKDPTMGSDRSNIPIAVNECTLAKNAIDVFEVSRTKEYIFYTLAAACTVLIFTNVAFASGDQVCGALSLGAAATEMYLDSAAKRKLTDRVKTLESTMTAEMLVGIGQTIKGALFAGEMLKKLGGTLGKDAATAGAKEASEKAATAGAEEASKEATRNWGCAVSAALAAIQGAVSTVDKNAALKANDTFLDNAQEKLNAFYQGNSIKNYDSGRKDSQLTLNKGVNSPGSQDKSADDCSSQNGNNFLKCMNDRVPDPQLSAILANKNLLDTTEKLTGRPLGDMVKSYLRGNMGPLPQAVSNGLNLGPKGPSLVEKLMNDGTKLAREFAGDRAGGAYVSRGKKEERKQDDVDFSKMMNTLLGQLNPDPKDKTREDPAEVVFRKLDLLPADKIEASKDISLFARIGYRYRKKTPSITEESKQ
jgi:hypothetical protein